MFVELLISASIYSSSAPALGTEVRLSSKTKQTQATISLEYIPSEKESVPVVFWQTLVVARRSIGHKGGFLELGGRSISQRHPAYIKTGYSPMIGGGIELEEKYDFAFRYWFDDGTENHLEGWETLVQINSYRVRPSISFGNGTFLQPAGRPGEGRHAFISYKAGVAIRLN